MSAHGIAKTGLGAKLGTNDEPPPVGVAASVAHRKVRFPMPDTTYHTGPSPRAVADTTHDISWAELLRRLSSYEGCVLDRMLAEARR